MTQPKSSAEQRAHENASKGNLYLKANLNSSMSKYLKTREEERRDEDEVEGK